MWTETQTKSAETWEQAIEEALMSSPMEIGTSISFLKCGVDDVLRVIFLVSGLGMERILLVGVVPLKTATMNGAVGSSLQNKPPHGPYNINDFSEGFTVLPLRSLTAMKFIPHFLACAMTLRLAPNKHFSIVYRNGARLLSA